jgi:hypothetical protein
MAYSSTLIMEVVDFFETSVNMYQTTQHHIREEIQFSKWDKFHIALSKFKHYIVMLTFLSVNTVFFPVKYKALKLFLTG